MYHVMMSAQYRIRAELCETSEDFGMDEYQLIDAYISM